MTKINGKTFNHIQPNTKIWVGNMTKHQKADIQRAAFASGIFWLGCNNTVEDFDSNAYYFYSDGSFTHDNSDDKDYFNKHSHKEIKWEDIFPVEKRPVDYLEDGCVVEFRNGDRMVYWENQKRFFDSESFMTSEKYSSDLLVEHGNSDWDIAAIYRGTHPNILFRLKCDTNEHKIVWRREPSMENKLAEDIEDVTSHGERVGSKELATRLIEKGWTKE